MDLTIDWAFFWDQLGPIIIVTAMIIVLLIAWVLWRHIRYKKVTVQARVIRSKELTDAWATMYVSRNPVLALGVRKMDVSFVTYNNQHGQGEVTLRTPVTKAEALTEGMRGRLCYRGTAFISFEPENKKKAGKS